ncbi:MAG: hypothetical protein ACYTGW_03490 [Planctomycetota bacterium]|jgi:hypothetical protein
MRRLSTALLCVPVLPLALAAQQPPAAPEGEEVKEAAGFVVPLTYRGQRRWKLRLPNEQWKPVGPAFDLSETHGHDFTAKLEGTRLLVDCDGDGKTDVKAEGTKAFLTLRGKTATGKPAAYAVRLINQSGWKFAPGGYLTGKIKNTTIRIIDQDNNGRYDDVGTDALVVGRGKVATYLSEVVNIGGELLKITVAQDGTELTCTPYEGPAGTLHLDCSTKGKVLSAVVRSTNKRFSFDMAKAGQGMKVPVGGYKLACGEIGLAESRVKMATGRSKPIAVAKDQTKKVCWGGPVRAEFAYQRRGEKVHFSPDHVWYFGAAGELYTNWVPLGASPKFTITDDDSGKEVAQAHFPGSC